jgi:hypothetical protein
MDMIDPSVATDPSKWLTPAGQMNPANPVGIYSHPDVKAPKVESAADLKARHKKLDDAYDKSNKDYADIMNKAHAMVASGTNYSHDALHDMMVQAGDKQRAMQHMRAMKAQLPALPSTVSPAFKARMAASTNQTTSDALDALAKEKMQAEAPEKK